MTPSSGSDSALTGPRGPAPWDGTRPGGDRPPGGPTPLPDGSDSLSADDRSLDETVPDAEPLLTREDLLRMRGGRPDSPRRGVLWGLAAALAAAGALAACLFGR